MDLVRACQVVDPAAEINPLIEAAHAVVFTHQELLREAAGLAGAGMRGVHRFERGFPRS